MKKSKKIIIYSLFIVVTAMVGGACLWFNSLERWTPPVRPEIVPEDAVWAGGYDGGSFFRVVSAYSDTTHFVIYYDGCGEVWCDGLFCCDKKDFERISHLDWRELLLCYNGLLLLMKDPDDNKRYIVWHPINEGIDIK